MSAQPPRLCPYLDRARTAELRRQWFFVAVQDGRVATIEEIARTVGATNGAFPCGPVWRACHGDVDIRLDDFRREMIVRHAGRVVCATAYGKEEYIPGEWEDQVFGPMAAAAAGLRQRFADWQAAAARRIT